MATEPKITIRDIAKTARVSVATISRALSSNKCHLVKPQTAQRVAEVVNKYHFIPNISARNLASLKTNTIGFAIPFYPGVFRNEYFSLLLSGIFRAMENSDYNFKLLVIKKMLDEKELDIFIRSNYLAGLLISNFSLIGPSQIAVAKLPIPVVLVNEKPSHPQLNYVTATNLKGGYEATRYLLSLGHQKIAIFRGNPGSGDDQARFEGFKKALRESNIVPRQDWILIGDFTELGGYKCGMQLLLMQERTTAVFCANDSMAVGLYRALKELNLECPKDISCVGYDNSQLSAYLTPPLSTVAQLVEEMGYHATQWMLEKFSGKTNTSLQEELETSLLIRKSARKI